MRKRAAFTLVELLIVLAVIVVLAGLLVPVLHNTRERSRQMRCASNLAQIGKALHMYADDWSGYVPPYNNADAVQRSLDAARLVQAFTPYLRNRDVWRCPTDPYYGQGVVASTNSVFSHRHGSYMTNPFVPPVITYSGETHPVRHARITPWRVDAPGTNAQRKPSEYLYLSDWFYWATKETVSHNGRANLLMFDGRVKAEPIPLGQLQSRPSASGSVG